LLCASNSVAIMRCNYPSTKSLIRESTTTMMRMKRMPVPFVQLERLLFELCPTSCKFQRCASVRCRPGIFLHQLPTPVPHSMTQHPPPSPFSNVSRAALVAASNTSSTPSPVSDEHSRYFRAPISCAMSDASRLPTKCCDFFRISSIATGSSLRSFFRPTSIIGTPGHLSFASSTHFQPVSMGGIWVQRDGVPCV
jgi:hypothetical protein